MYRIAITDDRDYLLKHTSSSLTQTGEVEVVFTAINGQDFLNKMKTLAIEQLPQVVLMDVEMPTMNGVEAVKQAVKQFPSVQFLMLTVFDDDDNIVDAIKAGAVGYLLKDEKTDNILQAIKEVIEYGGAPMSPRIARRALNLLSAATVASKTSSDDNLNTLLSDREIDILRLIVEGLEYREIAETLFISPFTVRTHTTNVYRKLHVSSKTEVVKLALKKRWF